MTQKYRVHVMAVIRVPFEVEAKGQVEAAEKAADMTWGSGNLTGEFADEITSFLVDEVGDEEYDRSRWYEYSEDKLVPMDPVTSYLEMREVLEMANGLKVNE